MQCTFSEILASRKFPMFSRKHVSTSIINAFSWFMGHSAHRQFRAMRFTPWFTTVSFGNGEDCSSWCSTVWQIKHEAGATVSKYLMTASLERWNIDAKSYSERRKLANFATASAHPRRSLNGCGGADARRIGRISGILDFSRSNKTMAAARHVRPSMCTLECMKRCEKLNAHWRKNAKLRHRELFCSRCIWV